MRQPAHLIPATPLVPSTGMRTGDTIETYIATRRWARLTERGARHTFSHFVAATGDPPIGELDREHVEAWWQTQATVAASTARIRHSHISCFLSWCRQVGVLAGDPLAGIPRPREPRRSPVTLSDDEVAALLAAVPDLRGDVVVKLMLWLGLRCVDVSRLEVGDVDFGAGMLRVTGKGGHVDVLPLPRVVATAIRRYLRAYPASSGPLVRAYDAPVRALTAQRLSELVGSWLRSSGVKRCRLDGRGAHSLRRTCATELLGRGANVRQVQAVMRHESLRSTEHYLRRADAEELRPLVEHP